jgi:metal-dependent amidase/aminoacylase/carboxypeptidase family protein
MRDHPGVDSMLNPCKSDPRVPFPAGFQPLSWRRFHLRPSAILTLVDQHAAHFSGTSRTIWEYAELGYQEEKSSALLQRELQSAGFRIQSPVADEPTAFIATFGQGEPVIGILGEFDALPGLSQAATPDRSSLVADGPGHGCGHKTDGPAIVQELS